MQEGRACLCVISSTIRKQEQEQNNKEQQPTATFNFHVNQHVPWALTRRHPLRCCADDAIAVFLQDGLSLLHSLRSSQADSQGHPSTRFQLLGGNAKGSGRTNSSRTGQSQGFDRRYHHSRGLTRGHHCPKGGRQGWRNEDRSLL